VTAIHFSPTGPGAGGIGPPDSPWQQFISLQQALAPAELGLLILRNTNSFLSNRPWRRRHRTPWFSVTAIHFSPTGPGAGGIGPPDSPLAMQHQQNIVEFSKATQSLKKRQQTAAFQLAKSRLERENKIQNPWYFQNTWLINYYYSEYFVLFKSQLSIWSLLNVFDSQKIKWVQRRSHKVKTTLWDFS
jgi:hypothetical protein